MGFGCPRQGSILPVALQPGIGLMGQSKEVDGEVNVPLIIASPTQKTISDVCDRPSAVPQVCHQAVELMITPPQISSRQQVSAWLIFYLCAISKPLQISCKSGANQVQILFSRRGNLFSRWENLSSRRDPAFKKEQPVLKKGKSCSQ